MNNNEIKNLLDIFLKKNNLEKGLLDLEVKRAWHELMENGVSNYTTRFNYKTNDGQITEPYSISARNIFQIGFI